MSFVKLDGSRTNRIVFHFPDSAPQAWGQHNMSESWVGTIGAVSGGLLPITATSPGERANLGMFALRPHAVFSLCPQPVNTETAPKNVVDTVSDSR